MQRRLLVWYRRFRTMYRPRLEGPSSSTIMWLYLLDVLKGAPSKLASFLRDASHLNSVWDIILCRWISWYILREENNSIEFQYFRKFLLFLQVQMKISQSLRESVLYYYLSSLLCLVNSNASVWWNPAEVAGDPGESNRVSQRATSSRTKRHNTNLSEDTITLQANKWATTVTL
jgi:hypothetical protein